MNPATAQRPAVAVALRTVTLLVVAYAVVSVLTVALVALLDAHHDHLSATAWTRSTVVAVVSLVTLSMAVVASRGSRGAWWRLRIATAVQIVAIAVVVAVPSSIPAWLRAEQVVCAVLLVAVAWLANGRQVRAAFGRSRS